MSVIENLSIKKKDFSLEIPRLELIDKGFHILWGPSGSGKTTLLRALIGLEECPTMRWDFQGINLAQLSPPLRRLGVVFQSLDLFPHMTARENILFAAKARNISKNEAVENLKRWSQKLLMDSFIDRDVHLLSGGEQQRVALLRALIGQPRMLILDEPFSHLDPHLRDEARTLLKNLMREFQLPVLVVTHDEKDIQSLGERITRLEDGRLQ